MADKTTEKDQTQNGPTSTRTTARRETNTQPTTNDRLAPAATPAVNEPSEVTFHCGYCGQRVGSEGQHTDPVSGEATMPEHAGTLVVADDWPALQDAQDAKKAEEANKVKSKTADQK